MRIPLSIVWLITLTPWVWQCAAFDAIHPTVPDPPAPVSGVPASADVSILLAILDRHVIYTRSSLPSGWTLTGPTMGHESIQFMIALKQTNVHELEQLFWEVSDPNHENYQNYMTHKEIMAIVAPEHETVHAVKHWLKQHGATHIKDFGDALEVDTTVSIASKLFSTTFRVFTHENGDMIIRQWGDYSIPIHIYKHIDMINGVSTFPVGDSIKHKFRRVSIPPLDDQVVIAQTIWSIYDVPMPNVGFSNMTSQGVIEFQGENFSPIDLMQYATKCNMTVQPISNDHIIGPNDPTNPTAGGTLDIQMLATVNNHATNWFWAENGNGWLYQYVVHFFGTATVPQVVSISYGAWEGGQCDIAPHECSQLGVNSQVYVERVNVEFMKIGLRGISVIVASGDAGASGYMNDNCSIPIFHATFPASSPYVTTVGATELINFVYNLTNPPPICHEVGLFGISCPSAGQEVAVTFPDNYFASGGGFSAYTSQPSYQAAAVSAYFNSGVAFPPSSYYNSLGRGFPDVSAIGHDIVTNQGDVLILVDGSGASTPIFAGLVTLLNEIAINKTGKTLGFLNPLLYQAHTDDPNNFNDITVGDNKCTDQPCFHGNCTDQGCFSNCHGFLATKGWDPVSGLGSINYSKLSNYISKHLDEKLIKQEKKSSTYANTFKRGA